VGVGAIVALPGEVVKSEPGRDPRIVDDPIKCYDDVAYIFDGLGNR
jgi:hypothetical protein